MSYTLHGKELNVGDKVWSIEFSQWWDVYDYFELRSVEESPEKFTWDIPPKIDLASISPPLCWIEGQPVRVGSAMMYGECAVVVLAKHGRWMQVKSYMDDVFSADPMSLTFNLPAVAPPMTEKEVTVWINKYDPDCYSHSNIYATEQQAKGYATHHCQGQLKVTYFVKVPT